MVGSVEFKVVSREMRCKRYDAVDEKSLRSPRIELVLQNVLYRIQHLKELKKINSIQNVTLKSERTCKVLYAIYSKQNVSAMKSIY